VPRKAHSVFTQNGKGFLGAELAMPIDQAIDVLNRERLFRMKCEQPKDPSDTLMAQRPSWPEVVRAVLVLRGVDDVLIRMLTMTDFSHVFVHFDLPPILQCDRALRLRPAMLN
jgi:hypothetical protein